MSKKIKKDYETPEEIREALKEAGIDRIIMENQRQLDAWLPKAKGR